MIASHSETYAGFLGGMSDADFRAEMQGFDGSPTSKGAFIVNLVLGSYAAYRTQLFLYLKACGRDELGTTNLWQGADPPAAAGHRPSVRRDSRPGHTGRAGPRSRHTRRQGGPTPPMRPNTGTRRARPRLHAERLCGYCQVEAGGRS